MKFISNLTKQQKLDWLIVLLLAGSGVLLGLQTALTLKKATIVIEWSTASEINTAGYNLLRRKTEGETPVQINDELIVPSGDSLTGGEYSYEDSEVEAGKTYTYILEVVDVSGERKRQGTITQKADSAARMKLSLAGICVIGAGILSWALTGSRAKNKVHAKTRRQNNESHRND